jgi:hypothetical protein
MVSIEPTESVLHIDLQNVVQRLVWFTIGACSFGLKEV